jgi:hypothetical protein
MAHLFCTYQSSQDLFIQLYSYSRTRHTGRHSDNVCIEKGQSDLHAPQLINRLSACIKSGPFFVAHWHILL